MKKLPVLALVFAAAFATAMTMAADLPEEVIVMTDALTAADFASWKPASAAGYAGTYSGDVGGDTNGKVTLKIAKTGDENMPYDVSGTYVHATVGMEPAVITFTHLTFDGPDEKYATAAAGPVSITFVSLNGQKGIVIGGAFLPRS